MTPFAAKIIQQAQKTPYFHLYDKDTGELYMERYWLANFNPDGNNMRVHKIMRSDDARALHDHPWASTSILLDGGYWEIEPEDQDQDPRADGYAFTRKWKQAGDVTHRKAHHRHRLEVEPGTHAWSLFIMGPIQKEWGFYDEELGFVYWRDYLHDYSTVTASDQKVSME